MIKLTIDRSKWARGGIKGEAMLLNDQGNMCCLGFACLAAGVTEIAGAGTPEDLGKTHMSKLSAFVYYDEYDYEDMREQGKWKDNHLVDDAVGVNDDKDINDEEREEKLKPILANLGFDVEFV